MRVNEYVDVSGAGVIETTHNIVNPVNEKSLTMPNNAWFPSDHLKL